MSGLPGFLSFNSCLLLVFLLILIPSATAELKFSRGDSVTVQSANSTISWVRNYSFDINRTSIRDKTLVLGNRNISIYSSNSAQVNSTLWKYKFSSPSYGDTLIRVQTSAVPGSAVHFRFTGLPTINKGEYRLSVDDEILKEFSSGGTVAWSYSDWSAHNFTVTYDKKPDDDGSSGDGDDSDDGSDSSGSGGGSCVRAGCEEAEKSDSHSWILVNRSEFVFNNIDPAMDIQRVEVNTQARYSEFAVCAGKLRNISAREFEKPANAYAFYQFEVDEESKTGIESATIRFEVNQSFATQYDRIVLSRYKDGWKDHDTTQIESTGDKWTYETAISGFSYYAVRGENQAENHSTGSQNQTTEDQTGSVCGDDLCQQSESWKSCSADCAKPEEAVEAENAILDAEQQISKGEPGDQVLQQAKSRFEKGEYSEAERLAQNALNQYRSQRRSSDTSWLFIAAAVAVLILFAVLGFYGYQHWIETHIDQEIQEIHEKVRQGHGEVGNAGEVRTELSKAEKALDMGKHRQAKKSLDRIEELLDR